MAYIAPRFTISDAIALLQAMETKELQYMLEIDGYCYPLGFVVSMLTLDNDAMISFGARPSGPSGIYVGMLEDVLFTRRYFIVCTQRSSKKEVIIESST